jgi:peroxiredoxin
MFQSGRLIAAGTFLLLFGTVACNTNSNAPEKTPGQDSSSSDSASPASPMMMGGDIKEKNFDRLPEFAFKDLTGKVVSSEQFRGKVLLIDVWATWCPPCREEMPWFEELQRTYASKGLAVIGVSIDPSADVAASFAKELGVTYTLLHRPEIMQEWGLLGLPTTFIVDRTGRIHSKVIGFEHKEKFEKAVKELL